VICGFPGETEEAFERTMQLIDDVKPEIVNISKFFARPKTPAAKMNNPISFSQIKARSAKLASLAAKIALEKNQSWVEWEGEIFVNEVGKAKGSWIGRNFSYKPVVVRSQENLLGKKLNVKIVRAFSTHLEGEIVNYS
ncbi:MAG: TRAM domain-containing protein, partial [Candidatus Freyarchaeota archaeon]